jgi:predicted amidohydrolase YtcJ
MNSRDVDLIVRNARNYTVDPGFGVADGMVVTGGRIVAVGDSGTIGARFRAARELDARGAFIYPGFIDPHSHFLLYGLTLAMANLVGSRSWEEVIGRVQDQQRAAPSSWAVGRGWDDNLWPSPGFPSREKLDAAFPDQPVLLVRIDGHAAVANAAALALAGVDADTRVAGGEVLRTTQGLTGVLIDKAIDLVRSFIPKPDRHARQQALLRAQANCLAVGLTTVSDAGTDLEDALLMDSLYQAGQLQVRIYTMIRDTDPGLGDLLAKGPHRTDRLSIASIKVFADGALGSRGALLLEPYADNPANRGLQVTPTARFEETCRRAAAAGFQVNSHCIGDAAVRLALDIYGKFQEPGIDRRWRIEHAQVVDPQDLPRFGRYRVIPSVQSTHATSDMNWAGKALGARIKHAYCFQELLQQNGWLPNGSDFPVEGINPLLGFYAAVARKDLRGKPEGGFQMENALTREQALQAMTIWAARASFDEDNRGSLEVGKWADFVMLDRDLMRVPEPEIPAAKVIRTFIAGAAVYGS